MHACYAQSLVAGYTIKATAILPKTLNLYLTAAGITPRPDPTTLQKRYTFPPLLSDVLNEYKRWHSIPNRREPITLPMLEHWRKLAQWAHEDSFQAAFYDWMVIGLHTGCRKSEWCQDTYDYKLFHQIAVNPDQSSKAFVASDFKLHNNPNGSKTNQSNEYEFVQIKWRFQKNGDNGQQISFAHDHKNASFSPVLAAQRILARAERLQVPHNMPIAVYKRHVQSPPASPYLFIDHHSVELELKSCARKVLKLTKLTDIARFTTHSIRVGACVLLHENGADSLLIKSRLRWRSDSFLNYLRNTLSLANAHADFINKNNKYKNRL